MKILINLPLNNGEFGIFQNKQNENNVYGELNCEIF